MSPCHVMAKPGGGVHVSLPYDGLSMSPCHVMAKPGGVHEPLSCDG